MQKTINNLDDPVSDTTEQSVVEALEAVMRMTTKILSRAHWGVLQAGS